MASCSQYSAAFGYQVFISPVSACGVDLDSVNGGVKAGGFIDPTSPLAANSKIVEGGTAANILAGDPGSDIVYDNDVVTSETTLKLLGLTNAALETDTSSETVTTYNTSTGPGGGGGGAANSGAHQLAWDPDGPYNGGNANSMSGNSGMLDWDIYGAGGGAGAGGDGGDATIVAHGAFMGGGGFDPEDPDEVFGGDGGAGVTMPNGDGTTVNVGGGGGGGANNNDFGYSGGGGAAGGASGRGANSETPSNDYAAESGTNYRGEGGGGGAGEYSTNTYSTGGNGGHGYAVITHDAANTPLNCTPAPHATGVHNGLRYYQFRVDTTITL